MATACWPCLQARTDVDGIVAGVATLLSKRESCSSLHCHILSIVLKKNDGLVMHFGTTTCSVSQPPRSCALSLLHSASRAASRWPMSSSWLSQLLDPSSTSRCRVTPPSHTTLGASSRSPTL